MSENKTIDLSEFHPKPTFAIAELALRMKAENPGTLTDGSIARALLGNAAAIGLSYAGHVTESDVGFVHEALVATLVSEIHRIRNNNARRN